MQKLKQKSNAKPVGAGLVSAQNKGITLIALIIAIIVMLILVGVTINVALNGGLFEKADEATKQTQIQAEKEELLSAVVAAIGNDGKLGTIKTPKGWEFSNGTYISPKKNKFTVDANGRITEGEKQVDYEVIAQILNSFAKEEKTEEEILQQLKLELSIVDENITQVSDLLVTMIYEDLGYYYIYEIDALYVVNFDTISFTYVEKEGNTEQYTFCQNIKYIKEELEKVFVGKESSEVIRKHNEGTLEDYVLSVSETIKAIEFSSVSDEEILRVSSVTLINGDNEINLSEDEDNYSIWIYSEDGIYYKVEISLGT